MPRFDPEDLLLFDIDTDEEVEVEKRQQEEERSSDTVAGSSFLDNMLHHAAEQAAHDFEHEGDSEEETDADKGQEEKRSSDTVTGSSFLDSMLHHAAEQAAHDFEHEGDSEEVEQEQSIGAHSLASTVSNFLSGMLSHSTADTPFGEDGMHEELGCQSDTKQELDASRNALLETEKEDIKSAPAYHSYLEFIRSLRPSAENAVKMNGVVAVPYNLFNAASVIASKEKGLSVSESLHKIYRGVEGAPANSFTNIFRGMGGHLSKEGSRFIPKAYGLQDVLPYLQQQYGTVQGQRMFAVGMGVVEWLAINPFDYWRVCRQAGQEFSITGAYKGGALNGARQTLTWGLWLEATRKFNEVAREEFGVEKITTETPFWYAAQQGFASFVFTLGVHPLERVKNEVMFDKTPPPKSWNPVDYFKASAQRTCEAAGEVGTKHLLDGFKQKWIAGFILALGAGWLKEQGQKKAAEQDEPPKAPPPPGVSHRGSAASVCEQPPQCAIS